MEKVFTNSDLQRMLFSREPVLAVFYASWCPFCQRFIPVFIERVKETIIQAVLVNLDDTSNPLWEAYGISVVPTIFYFSGQTTRRLDGVLGIGISERQLGSFLKSIKLDSY